VERLGLQLSDASGVPYYRQIFDQMAQMIRSGQMEPGSQLPSVRDLSNQLLVSLITVRRAYADLEAADLIVRKQGYGTYVAEDVQMASRKQAKSEARFKLSEAVTHALQLGLTQDEIRSFLDDLFTRQGGKNDNQ
jgi:GntR family transcriptional regulator